MSALQHHPDHIFTVAGIRETINEQRAIELVKPLQDAIDSKQHDRYTKLVLTNKSFTIEAAHIFSNIIQQLHGITHCDYSDIIAGQSTDNAVEVLNILTRCLDKHKLIEFNISDNALGQKGIIAIGTALSHHDTLQHVYFNNNGLQGDAVNEIAVLLVGHKHNVADNQLHNLHTFEIFNNLLTDTGGIALSTVLHAATQLRHIKIQTNRISEAGGTAIMTALKHHKHLHTLILSDNSFGGMAGQIALNLVVTNPNLHVLNISDIGFEKTHILGIIKQLANPKVTPKLCELHLSHSELTQHNVTLLIQALHSKQHIHTLVLEGNELHSKGCIELLNALQTHPHIKHINLNENQISQPAVDSIISFIKSNKTIQLLSLKNNLFNDESVELIQSAVEHAHNQNILIELDDQEADDEDIDDDSDNDEIAEPDSSDIDLDKEEHEIDELAHKIDATKI